MKWLMLLFAMYILVLSAMPCCDKDCCADKTAQSSQLPHKQEAPCSPFFLCNTCHGFIIPEANITLAKPVINIPVISPFVMNDDLADFSVTAWQPPKIG